MGSTARAVSCASSATAAVEFLGPKTNPEILTQRFLLRRLFARGLVALAFCTPATRPFVLCTLHAATQAKLHREAKSAAASLEEDPRLPDVRNQSYVMAYDDRA